MTVVQSERRVKEDIWAVKQKCAVIRDKVVVGQHAHLHSTLDDLVTFLARQLSVPKLVRGGL